MKSAVLQPKLIFDNNLILINVYQSLVSRYHIYKAQWNLLKTEPILISFTFGVTVTSAKYRSDYVLRAGCEMAQDTICDENIFEI